MAATYGPPTLTNYCRMPLLAKAAAINQPPFARLLHLSGAIARDVWLSTVLVLVAKAGATDSIRWTL